VRRFNYEKFICKLVVASLADSVQQLCTATPTHGSYKEESLKKLVNPLTKSVGKFAVASLADFMQQVCTATSTHGRTFGDDTNNQWQNACQHFPPSLKIVVDQSIENPEARGFLKRKDFKGLRLVTKPGTPSPEYGNAFPTRDGRAQSNLKNSLIANLVYVVVGSIANIPANDLCCVLWVVCVVYCSRDLDRRVNIRFRPKSFDLQNQLFLTLKIDY
jgi:hypothetical protein